MDLRVDLRMDLRVDLRDCSQGDLRDCSQGDLRDCFRRLSLWGPRVGTIVYYRGVLPVHPGYTSTLYMATRAAPV